MSNGNKRKVSGNRITIASGVMKLQGIEIQNGQDCEWILFPKTEDEWQRIRREHPNALVLIPLPPEQPKEKEEGG